VFLIRSCTWTLVRSLPVPVTHCFESHADKISLALPQARQYIEMLSTEIRNALVVEV
jgi:hypothetical protein